MTIRESKAAPAGTATLTYDGQGLRICRSSRGPTGPNVVDIRKLYGEADVFTYDPGFTSTASCESDITFIDGDKGMLLYRGYPIDQLAEHSNFLEVCYLLLNGELPNKEQMEDFDRTMTITPWCTSSWPHFFRGFRRDAHPMAIMCGVVGALSAFYHDSHRHQRSAPARDRQPPPDRQDADHRGDGLQISRRPALRVSAATIWATPRISCA